MRKYFLLLFYCVASFAAEEIYCPEQIQCYAGFDASVCDVANNVYWFPWAWENRYKAGLYRFAYAEAEKGEEVTVCWYIPVEGNSRHETYRIELLSENLHADFERGNWKSVDGVSFSCGRENYHGGAFTSSELCPFLIDSVA